MPRPRAQRRQARLVLVVGNDPRRVPADRDHARAAESARAHAKDGVTVIVSRTVRLTDPLARANVVDALQGPGGPAGLVELREDGDELRFRFDDAVSTAELVDDLVAIESVFVPARDDAPLGADEAAAIAAAGLGDPELDAMRVIERHLPEDAR